jgi:hypothetical protein
VCLKRRIDGGPTFDSSLRRYRPRLQGEHLPVCAKEDLNMGGQRSYRQGELVICYRELANVSMMVKTLDSDTNRRSCWKKPYLCLYVHVLPGLLNCRSS